VAAGCGGSAGAPALPPGGEGDDGGGGSFVGADAGSLAALDAHIEDNHVAVTVVVLGCAGNCATVEAVGTGGNPPYKFAWDDGSTSAVRQVCPKAGTSYHVTVTDSATGGEFARPPQSVQAPLTASVDACSDGGPAEAGGTEVGRITVPGTADIWLAGQSDGTTIKNAAYAQMDTAPTNSPVEVPVTAGSTLTFTATGSTTSSGFCTAATPDGGGCIGDVSVAGASTTGISNLAVAQDALVGVFLDGSVPSGSPPPTLQATGADTSFASLSPLLRQQFFIGDGLTGTGSGSVQRFVVPAGATRLFLGSSDGFAGNSENGGQFTVVVSTL
jgi:hypothetical protein